MANFPDVKPDNESISLLSFNQSYESLLTGDKQTAELSGDKWAVVAQFSNRHGEDAAKLRAFLFSQGGSRGRFTYSPESISNIGNASGAGVVDGAGQAGSSVMTKGWDGGQTRMLAAGDYFEVNGELKIVTSDVTQSASYTEYAGVNQMPSPFDPAGWTDGANGSVSSVTMVNPSGSSVIGLATQDGAGYFTMQDSFPYDLSVVAGERVYIGIILKPVDASPFDLSVVIGGSVTPIKTLKVAVESLTVRSSSMTDYQVTDLGDGFKLFEAYWVVEADDPDMYGRYTFTASNTGTAAPIGSQVYVQASFFGKASDWPASHLAKAEIPFAPKLRKSPPSGASIITDKPSATFRLEGDDQSAFQVTGPLIYNASISMIEDF